MAWKTEVQRLFAKKTSPASIGSLRGDLPGPLRMLTQNDGRNSITNLFEAVKCAGGMVIVECMPRHRHHGLLTFPKQLDATTPRERDLQRNSDDSTTDKRRTVRRPKQKVREAL